MTSRTTVFALLLSVGALSAWAETAKEKASGPPRRPTAEIAAETKECLSCHNDPELEIDLDSGEVMLMHVDPEALPGSVHKELGCTDCHVEYRGETNGHKSKTLKAQRDFRVFYSEQCKECHFATYTQTLDGVHHAVNVKGEKEAAVCADCHGGHAMHPAAEPRAEISKTCASCHEEVSKVYTASVHGKGLSNGSAADVPVCTDCHRSHDIADPRSGAAKLQQPDTCGTCHTDARMMEKYGLSTMVLSTYLADFHGATTLLQKGDKNAQPVVAVCSDCHGVHDITKVDEPGSKVVKANLAQTCRSCHEGATDDFPDAWMSHYEPTWEKAPLVKAVQVFYDFLIPFMIGGLALQVLLHLWRVLVNR